MKKYKISKTVEYTIEIEAIDEVDAIREAITYERLFNYGDLTTKITIEEEE